MGFDEETLRKRIYCHRGFWRSQEDQNSLNSLRAAASSGFGIETDVRDSRTNLVIAHDAFSESKVELSALYGLNVPIALNIKSDGLLRRDLGGISESLSAPGSFAFDGSIPEMLQYKKAGLPHALRVSEYEPELSWKCKYIWLDAFESDWWVEKEILPRLSENHFVIIVSPELHSRNHEKVWSIAAKEIFALNPNVAICTDKPIEFFGILQ
ncbi:hypothetical protein MCEMRE182_00046 [Candidatus Nanopelagicaceae bacterium]